MAIIKKTNPGVRYVHTDQYNIIGHAYHHLGGVEGGDSACWNGHYNYFSKNKDGVDYVDTFEVKPGAYVRHPHQHPQFNRFGWFYGNPWDGNTSRDQLTGVLLGIIEAKDKGAMLRMIAHWALRLFLFAYNSRKNGQLPGETPWKLPDFTGPNMWQMALRGFGVFSWIFFIPLCILDLHILIDTLIVNKSDDDDSINYFGRLAVSRNHVPTPVSWLALKLLDREHLKSLIRKYWGGLADNELEPRHRWRDNPGMYDIHSKAIDELT